MIRKQAGQMMKLLGLWDNSKRKSELISGQEATVGPGPRDGIPQFLDRTQGLNRRHVTRRQIVLNRHFTEIISEILANNLKTQLSDIGVTIKSIETKAWNKGVSVFYYTNKPFESSLHKELNTLNNNLRAAIAERRLIGRVPIINFIYDKSSEAELTLNQAILKSKIEDPQEVTEITKIPSNQIQASSGFRGNTTTLFSKMFSASADMNNMILGLDYPSLYNQVAKKLERGRAESSRMISGASLASTAPFIRVPPEIPSDSEELDATKRILNMQKFLISQRKKSEHLAKLRRKQELFARDSYKWDILEEQETTIEQDVQEKEE